MASQFVYCEKIKENTRAIPKSVFDWVVKKK